MASQTTQGTAVAWVRTGSVARAVAVACAVAVAAPAPGQDPEPPVPVKESPVKESPVKESPVKESPAEPPAISGPRQLFMVVETPPTMKPDELKDKVRQGVAMTKGCKVESLRVQPIGADAYTLLKGIVEKGPLSVAQGGGDVQIQPQVADLSTWTIDLGNAETYLKSLKLEVAGETDDAKTETLSFDEPAAKNAASAPLKYHSPGVYLLKVPEGRTPRGAELTIVDEKDAVRTRKVEWPVRDVHYVIVLEGFEGDEGKLFETLCDETKINNAIRDIKDATRTSLVLASFRDKFVPDPIAWQGNTFVVGFPRPTKGTARVWLLFPLTEAQEAEESRVLHELLNQPEGFAKLPAAIRTKRAPAGRTVVLPPNAPPRWYEVTWEEATSRFELRLTLEDVAGWKNAAEGSEGRALVVYEFESQGLLRPIKVEERYIGRRTFKEWPLGLKNLQPAGTPADGPAKP